MQIIAKESIYREVICCAMEEMQEVIKSYKSKGYNYVDTADIKFSSGKVLVFEITRVITTTEQLQSFTW